MRSVSLSVSLFRSVRCHSCSVLSRFICPGRMRRGAERGLVTYKVDSAAWGTNERVRASHITPPPPPPQASMMDAAVRPSSPSAASAPSPSPLSGHTALSSSFRSDSLSSSSATFALIRFFFFSLALSAFSSALFCQVSVEVKDAAAEEAPAEPRAKASPNLGWH